MDLFGESFWYSDTTHVREPYMTYSEVKRDISPEYLNQKKDVIMPLYAKSHRGIQKTEIGKVAVNPKNIVYGAKEKEGVYRDVSGQTGSKIWGDILDEGGNKTGKQILLQTELNVLKESTGNLYNYRDQFKTPGGFDARIPVSDEDKTFGLVIQELMSQYTGSEFLRKEGSEIGYSPVRDRRSKKPYIYKDKDGTQYSSSQAPYGESK
tara:strand:- start:358 stop:981 length:624 start_codon:yes stop_codon:yes gene_type:complete